MRPIRCILNADDFGRSRSVNTAIIKAHTEGVLTSYSLMVSGEASEEAVHLAREHPAVFDIVLEAAAGFGIRHLRLPKEELSLHRRLSRRWPPDLLTAATFTLLYRRNVKRARARGFIFAERVYGLLQTNRLDEAYLCALLQSLGGQTNEIYCHPDTATARGRVELHALLSPNVTQTVARLGLRLINHTALEAPPPGPLARRGRE